MTTYARLPVTFTRGKGSWLWDENDKKYLDALTGIAVCGLGHANPAVAKAISAQAARLSSSSATGTRSTTIDSPKTATVPTAVLLLPEDSIRMQATLARTVSLSRYSRIDNRQHDWQSGSINL